MFDIDPEEYYRQSRGFQLPLGLRSSRNPFNIKYYKGAERDQGRWPGLLGPSTARDQGDPQMLFSDLESGGRSAAQLLLRKYQGGARTANDIIAGRSGWTPGYGAAATSVANFAGVRPDQDLALNTAEGMRRFLPALFRQEQGPTAARMMNPGLFDRIVAGLNFGGGAPRAALGMPAPLAQVPTPPAILTAARTELPGRIGNLGAGGVVPPNWQPPTKRGPDYDPGVAPVFPPAPGVGGDYARDTKAFLDESDGSDYDESDLPSRFPLHDPSAFGIAPPEDVGSGIFGAMETPQPFPLTAPVPPDDETASSVVVPPATDTGAAPETALARAPPAPPPAGLAPQQVVDRSLAARMFGPDFAGSIRGIINNEAVRSGLGILTNHPELAGNLANAQRTEIAQQDAARRRVLEGREDTEYYRKLAAYNKTFPNGEPDLNSPLLKNMGLTPQAAATVALMGPEGAVKFLADLQLKDAEARAATVRDLEDLATFRQFRQQGGFTGQPTAAGTPPALASQGPPVPPDIGGLGQPSIGAPAGNLPPQAGPLLSRLAAPQPAAAGRAPPAAAPSAGGAPAIANPAAAMPQLPPMGGAAAPAPAPAQPVGPEPIVNTLLGPMPLSEAEAFAQFLERRGKPTAELRAAITAARAPQQKYQTDLAEGQAKQELGKPAQRGQISTTLDSIAMTKALAEKVKSDENLPRVLGPPLWRVMPNVYEGTRNVQANLDTLLKRQALDTMARLKQQSATGATGFGSTNDKELGIITGALTNLEDQNQSPAQYKQNIDTLVTALTNAERRIREGWKETYHEEYAEPGGKAPDAYPTKTAETQVERGRAARAARGLKADADLPRIKGEADFAALPPDTDFIDPFGKKRHKPRE